MSAGQTASARTAAAIFLGFAFAYFFSALLRAVTATLAPVFSAELGIGAGQLGLLAGAYFFGFCVMQLPLGAALDRHGPKRVLLSLLAVAVLGCVAFALSSSLTTLVLARALIGAGVSACLMAPLTCFRAVFTPPAQLRANSWMLMTGSMGMLASTLPVQWLLPAVGWRGLFWALAAMLMLAMAVISLTAPRDASRQAGERAEVGFWQIARQPLFRRMAPLGFFHYGGMIAMQSLWIGPWLTGVAGWSAEQAASGLFAVNICMLGAFMLWGALMPRLASRAHDAQQLMTWGVPLSLAGLLAIVLAGHHAGAWAWAAWCVSSTVVSLSQPAVGQAFPPAVAGRAFTAFNLVIFGGVFALQWGIGLLIDGIRLWGASTEQAFRLAMFAYWCCCALSYLWLVFSHRPDIDNVDQARST